MLGRNIGDYGRPSDGFTSPFSICRTGRGRLERPCSRGAQCGLPEIPRLFDQDHDPVHVVRILRQRYLASGPETDDVTSGSRPTGIEIGFAPGRANYCARSNSGPGDEVRQ